MKMVDITEASLADYGREAGEKTWVLTRDGKPVAAVMPIPPGMDPETFALSHNADFIEIINRSWKGYEEKGGISPEEVRRKYGVKRRSRRKATRRSR